MSEPLTATRTLLHGVLDMAGVRPDPDLDMRIGWLVMERDEARAEVEVANARLREMGSREEDLETQIEEFAGDLRAARLDGARGMREAASNAAEDVYDDLHARGDSAEAMGASRAAEAIRALDPATVGSGS